MIKKSLSILCAALFVCSISGAAKAEKLEFVVGEWPPFISKSLPGNGPHAKRLTEIYKKAGVDIEFKFMKWKRVYELVKTGKAVGSFSWYKTDERTGEVNFPTTPLDRDVVRAYYLKSKHPNGLGASSMEDLSAKGVKFVGVKSFWYEAPLKKMGANVSFVGEGKAAWKVLHSGRADVFLESEIVAKAAMKEYLGDAAMADIAFEDVPTKTTDMFPIFAKTHAQGEKALKDYEANAK